MFSLFLKRTKQPQNLVLLSTLSLNDYHTKSSEYLQETNSPLNQEQKENQIQVTEKSTIFTMKPTPNVISAVNSNRISSSHTSDREGERPLQGYF